MCLILWAFWEACHLKLTPRQRQFLDQLTALWRTHNRSVHYSEVAQALGVSPFSAYDMLKVLEGKNAVASEYVLESDASGPGRSAIKFYPLGEPAPGLPPPGGIDEPEWGQVMSGLLERLRGLRETNIRETLADMLDRLADYGSPLSYCSGVIAAHLVSLRLSIRGFPESTALRPLRVLVSSGEVGLGTLAGLSIGTSLAHLRGSPLLEPLLESARDLPVRVSQLSAEGRQRLADFVREAIAAIEGS